MSKKVNNFLVSLLSRKFLLAVISSVFVACNYILEWGLSEAQIATVLAPIAGFLITEGTADIVSRTRSPAPVDFTSEDQQLEGTREVWTGAARTRTFDEAPVDE